MAYFYNQEPKLQRPGKRQSELTSGPQCIIVLKYAFLSFIWTISPVNPWIMAFSSSKVKYVYFMSGKATNEPSEAL